MALILLYKSKTKMITLFCYNAQCKKNSMTASKRLCFCVIYSIILHNVGTLNIYHRERRFFAVSFFIVIYFLFSSSNEFSDKKQIQILVDGNDMDKFSIVAIHVESKNIWNLLLFIWNCFLNNKMSRFFVCWKFIHVYICNTDYSTINVTESKQRLKRC